MRMTWADVRSSQHPLEPEVPPELSLSKQHGRSLLLEERISPLEVQRFGTFVISARTQNQLRLQAGQRQKIARHSRKCPCLFDMAASFFELLPASLPDQRCALRDWKLLAPYHGGGCESMPLSAGSPDSSSKFRFAANLGAILTCSYFSDSS